VSRVLRPAMMAMIVLSMVGSVKSQCF